MFVWSYITNYNYINKSNELIIIKKEIENLKEEINNEEKFYKTIIGNLSEYLNLLNKNKKQGFKNLTTPTTNTTSINSPIIKKDDKKEKIEKTQTYFQKIKSFVNKGVNLILPNKIKEVKEVKEVKKNNSPLIPTAIPAPSPTQPQQIPNVSKGDGKRPQNKEKETENWKKK